MAVLILEAKENGEAKQVLISEEDFRDAGEQISDYFACNAKDAEIIGKLEVEGDTQYFLGSYTRD